MKVLGKKIIKTTKNRGKFCRILYLVCIVSRVWSKKKKRENKQNTSCGRVRYVEKKKKKKKDT